MKEKHIENLTKGKKSGSNIGSRGVPHRLKQHEQEKFTLAIKRRFLVVDFDSRENLTNIWKKYCIAKKWRFVVIEKSQSAMTLVSDGKSKVRFESRKAAMQYAAEVVSA